MSLFEAVLVVLLCRPPRDWYDRLLGDPRRLAAAGKTRRGAGA